MLLTRSEPILFERQDRTQIYTPPVTRGQMREVLDLDRKETADMSGRRGQQVAIFLRNAQWLKADGWTHAGTLQELLDSLTLAEEIDILHAITAQHHGLRPEDAVAVQQAMRDILKKKLNSTPPTSS